MKPYKVELNLLKKHYQETFDYVTGDDLCMLYAKEKMHHSLQVIGAGNYLIKHESVFQNKSDEYIRCATLAYLFHDIGRFREIRAIYDNRQNGTTGTTPNPDHSVLGAEILAKMPAYNDPRIIIPVRHHGHMVSDLYQDGEYLAIQDKKTQREIEEILFLVRDADKIANLRLMSSPLCTRDYGRLFFNKKSATDTDSINPEIENTFKRQELVKNKDCYSAADRFYRAMAWIFDLNYYTSFVLVHQFNIIDGLTKMIQTVNTEYERQENLAIQAKDYLLKKIKKRNGNAYSKACLA